MLKKEILNRCKLEASTSDVPVTPITSAKAKESVVPVKRKFENDHEKPTIIPAQPRPKTGNLPTPVFQKNYLS
jgi:hypothetical protein